MPRTLGRAGSGAPLLVGFRGGAAGFLLTDREIPPFGHITGEKMLDWKIGNARLNWFFSPWWESTISGLLFALRTGAESGPPPPPVFFLGPAGWVIVGSSGKEDLPLGLEGKNWLNSIFFTQLVPRLQNPPAALYPTRGPAIFGGRVPRFRPPFGFAGVGWLFLAPQPPLEKKNFPIAPGDPSGVFVGKRVFCPPFRGSARPPPPMWAVFVKPWPWKHGNGFVDRQTTRPACWGPPCRGKKREIGPPSPSAPLWCCTVGFFCPCSFFFGCGLCLSGFDGVVPPPPRNKPENVFVFFFFVGLWSLPPLLLPRL